MPREKQGTAVRHGLELVGAAEGIFMHLHKVVVAVLLAGAQHAGGVVFQAQDGFDKGGFLFAGHVAMVEPNIHGESLIGIESGQFRNESGPAPSSKAPLIVGGHPLLR